MHFGLWRFKFRTLVVLVGAALLAQSAPAYPKPKKITVAAHKLVDKRAVKPLANPKFAIAKVDPLTRARMMRAARFRVERRTALRPAMPVSQFSAKPTFGWPSLVTEARKYLGTNPTAMSSRWCARFMNMVLNKAGYAGTGSDAARSFVGYGRRVSEPRIGAIAVLSRGKNRNLGHVGIVTGIDPRGNPIIISGNHGRRVGEGTYPRNRVLAYVVPAEQPTVARAATGAVTDAEREGIASPIDELLAAINNEKPGDNRRETRTAQTAPPVPARIVPQTPQEPPVRTRMIEQTAAQAQASPQNRAVIYSARAQARPVPANALARLRVKPRSGTAIR